MVQHVRMRSCQDVSHGSNRLPALFRPICGNFARSGRHGNVKNLRAALQDVELRVSISRSPCRMRSWCRPARSLIGSPRFSMRISLPSTETVHCRAAVGVGEFELHGSLAGGDQEEDAKENGRRGPAETGRPLAEETNRAVAAGPFGQPVARASGGGPRSARRPDTAGCPGRNRWPSGNAACGPSPGPSSRSSPGRGARGRSAWPGRSCDASRPSWRPPPKVLIRVLGCGGSSSRIMRRISS